MNQHTDKLIIFTILVALSFLILHELHDGMDHEVIAWTEKTFDMFAGALLTLINGSLMRANQSPSGVPPANNSTQEKETK